MSRAIEFWKQQPSILESMFLRPDAKIIDDLERQEILNLLPSYQNKTVLDLAAGIGRFTREFVKTATHVTAVDVVPEFTEENRRTTGSLQNITYLTANVMDLRFPKATFDLIFINWLFMYLEDKEVEEISSRLKDWLKPEGTLFFRETCAAVPQSHKDWYPVHYRGLSFYHRVMDPLFDLRGSGSIQAYIDRFAHPFQCYWLYQAIPSNCSDSARLSKNFPIPLSNNLTC